MCGLPCSARAASGLHFPEAHLTHPQQGFRLFMEARRFKRSSINPKPSEGRTAGQCGNTRVSGSAVRSQSQLPSSLRHFQRIGHERCTSDLQRRKAKTSSGMMMIFQEHEGTLRRRRQPGPPSGTLQLRSRIHPIWFGKLKGGPPQFTTGRFTSHARTSLC